MRNQPEAPLDVTELIQQRHKAFWAATIKQAWEDVTTNGGLPEKGGESANMKLHRQLEAYHWLFTERSDRAFRSQGVWAGDMRDMLRTELRNMGWKLPQGAVTRLRLRDEDISESGWIEEAA